MDENIDKPVESKVSSETVKTSDSIKIQKSWIYIGIVAILIIAALIFFLSSKTNVSNQGPNTVSNGNIVQVMYVGKLDNGTIFDTNYEAVARSAGLFNPQREYSPLTFQVGSGQMIPGFENNVLGMKLGQKKSFTLTPDQAYGEYDESKLNVVPRIEIINRTENIPRTIQVTSTQFNQAFGEDPVIGNNYSSSQIPWNYTVSNVSSSNVTLSVIISKGDEISLSDLPWKSEVINVNSTDFIIQHNPTQGQIVPTGIGNATVDLTEKEIRINITPQKGAVMNLPTGPVTVKDFNATSIIIDSNSPLAGKNLTFEVEVVNITAE